MFRQFLFPLFSLLISVLTTDNALCATSQNHQIYSMNDLKALANTENYQEFFTHSLDVLPSLRDKNWEELTKTMAEKYINTFQKSEISQADYQLLFRVFKYSHLKKDEFFREKRDKFLVSFIKQQQTTLNEENLIKLSLEIHKNFPTRLTLGNEILNQIYPGLRNNEQTYLKIYEKLRPLIQELITSQYSEFYCNQGSLDNYLTDLLYYSQSEIKQIHHSCLEKLVPIIKQDLKNNNTFVRKKAFEFLKDKGLIGNKEIAQYHTLNLLYGEQYQKQEWDKVINSLKTLGENNEYRDDLITRIEKLDPYPDYIFTAHNEKQLIGLSRVISRHFPEYLDRYTNLCLNYLSGKVKYPNGNPTPNCHRYMEISKSSKSSPLLIMQQYDQIMNSWKKL